MSVERGVRTGRVLGAGRRATVPAASALLIAGAALVMASAAIHLHLWADGYRYIVTIGPLFFVQGLLGIFVSVLVALVRRVFVALLGALFSLGTIVGLLLASHGGLFGYRTTMSAPWASTALAVEIAAVALLCSGGALAVWAERSHVWRWRAQKTLAR